MHASGLANALAILSAVLIGFAVMSFVAANWQEMPRILRLALLIAALWASYGLAGWLARRGLTGFAHAAILLGVAIFGGSIMLVSQMYHMDGNPADAVLLWATGALLAGVALRSNPSLAFAMVLVVYWGISEALRLERVFWPFLIPWALISAAFYWQRWRPGLHLSGLALTGFVISLGYRLNDGHAHGLVVAAGLAIMAASIGDLVGYALRQPRRAVARLRGLLGRGHGHLQQDHRHALEQRAVLPRGGADRVRPRGRRLPPQHARRAGRSRAMIGKVIGTLTPASWAAIALVALLQPAALATMVYGRVTLLRDGREIATEVIPVDPRDLFRGDYVILGYAFGRTQVPVPEGVSQGDRIYVTLREAEPEKWEVVKATAGYEPAGSASEVVLKGIVDNIYRPPGAKLPRASIRYGIESYFVPEGTGRELEAKVREKKISAVLAVGSSGDVAIKALVVDGERVAEEPWL